jgi:hypothetical protein
MSKISIDDLSQELGREDLARIRGGIWDYSNRLGGLGQMLEDRKNPPTLGENGPTIDDAASAGDDSVYYPGLTPLR